MTFGPQLTATYAEPRPGKLESVRLAPFTPAEAQPLFPFPEDDPALAFIQPVANFLRAKSPIVYMLARTLPKGVAGWGVWDQSQLLGFVELAPDEARDDVASLGIVLGPNAREKGAGPLAVAAALDFAFSPNKLAGVIEGFSALGAAAVDTLVDPLNEPSLGMCQGLGFRVVGERTSYTGSRWLELELRAPADQIYRPEGFLFD